MQTRDVGAFRPYDAREAGPITKSKEPNMSRHLCLLDRFLDCGFGLVDARLITTLQSPGRVTLLGISVILDNLPLFLSGGGTFGIINAGC